MGGFGLPPFWEGYMALLELETVKRHLRVFHDDEDSQIEIYAAAAESIVTEYLDREVVATGETPALPDGIAVGPAIVAAILLVAADLYENREPDMAAQGEVVLPRHVRALLAPWRVWRSIPEED